MNVATSSVASAIQSVVGSAIAASATVTASGWVRRHRISRLIAPTVSATTHRGPSTSFSVRASISAAVNTAATRAMSTVRGHRLAVVDPHPLADAEELPLRTRPRVAGVDHLEGDLGVPVPQTHGGAARV